MTVESNSAYLLAKKLRLNFSMNEKQKAKPVAHCTRDFPALFASYRQGQGILIGHHVVCSCCDWAITLVFSGLGLGLVFRQSFEHYFKLCTNLADLLYILKKKNRIKFFKFL